MIKEFFATKIAYAAEATQLISNIKKDIINPIIAFFMVLSTVVFIWGVIEMIAGAENEEKRTAGKLHIIYGLIGLFIMIASGGLISIICVFFGLSANCQYP
ncbi:MAG: hypothetical protein HYW71_01315 [Candidatus Niyogibacteria bacterium]|nr:hypothetical protein [Candidatus Niyogibacteria bacterium]